MRRGPRPVGCYMHITKRGARGMEIVRDDSDRWRFVKLLYYLNNNNYRHLEWEQELFRNKIPIFTWPAQWLPREKLVEIVAYILMPNHFHLFLKEIREGGISIFMQGLCGSMTLHFNEKYNEKGSIFQGAYKDRMIGTDEYFKQVAVYIMVKNSFELLPGGIEKALKDFDSAWDKAISYKFSSLADYTGQRNSPVIDKGLLGEIFKSPAKFKEFARDTMFGRKIDIS